MRLKTYTIPVLTLLFSACVVAPATATQTQDYYQTGSIISEEISLQDQNQSSQGLTQLLEELDKPVNLLYLFGGGGMGHERTQETGGLWCPDSFEDMHILRSLAKHFEGRVGFIPIAIPPVFHTKLLGFGERVMLDAPSTDLNNQQALKAFIDSTQTAFDARTIPIQPLYDLYFNLLISEQAQEQRKATSPRQKWHGAFRAADETQSYGVPNFWLVDNQGKVLREPFRGNVYHPHNEDISINYSLLDVVTAIKDALTATNVK